MNPVAIPHIPVRAPLRYHTAYGHGNVTKSDGSFEHYICILDDTHKHLGHWRFASYEDDQRAHALGFRTPEQLLADQARSNEPYVDIHLRWVPGTNDPNLQTALHGTVTEHLRNIYEIRKVLDMPISLRGEIPLLPVSQDMRLKRYWEIKLAQRPIPSDQTPAIEAAQSSSHVQVEDSPQTQTGCGLSTQPGNVPLPSSSLDHAEGPQDAEISPAVSSAPNLDGISKRSHSGDMTQGHQLTLNSARSASKGSDLQSPPLSSGPAPLEQENTPAILPPLALPHESVQPASGDDAEISKSKSQGKLPRGNAHSPRSLTSTTTSKSPSRPTSFQSTSNHVSHLESSSLEDQSPQSGMPIGLQSDSLEENAIPKSLGMIDAEQRRDSCYDDTCVFSELPCMDCGEVDSHLFDCNLGSMCLLLKLFDSS